MPDLEIRRLEMPELGDYKRLRDASLERHPEAFSSDALESRDRPPASYVDRLGLDRPDGGHFTLAAWRGALLAGAVTCERETRRKVRHVAHVTAMMVRSDCAAQGIGKALLAATIDAARQAAGLEMLTLSVTATNLVAVRLYQRAGFERYSTLPRAIRVDGRYLTKDQMVLVL